MGGDTRRERFGALLEKNSLLLHVCLGYALCRSCSELAVVLPAFPTAPEELGKLVGLAFSLIAAYRLNPSRNRATLNAAPSCLMLASSVALALPYALAPEGEGPVPGALAAASFFVGFGTTAMMMQWLECCGLLPIKKIVVAVSAAYVLNSLLVFAVGTAGAPVLVFAALTAFSVANAALRHGCMRREQTLEGLARHPRTVALPLSRTVPLDVVLWLVFIGLAFSVVESEIDGSVIGTTIDNAGRAVPCVVVLLCYFLLADRFDMRYLYATTLPLLIAGLALCNHGDTSPLISQLFFCMGAAISRLVAYFIVCTRAYQHRASSFFGCAVVMFLNVLSHNAGAVFAQTAFFAAHRDTVVAVAIVATATVVVFLLIREMDWFAQTGETQHPVGPASNAEVVEVLARRVVDKPLTPRERTVLAHMVAGETNAEISDSLFISRGAVRSHTSRIYEKLGVHSRQELEGAVEEIEREG